MHMRFTDEELSTLAEMLTLACWVTFWNHKPEADDGAARYDDMLEKVLVRLQHNGQGDQVENDPERQRLRLSKEKEEDSFYAQCYDEMRNETFWEELSARMAEKELALKYSDQYFKSLSDEERKKITKPISKKYWQEFSKKGITNLHLIFRHDDG